MTQTESRHSLYVLSIYFCSLAYQDQTPRSIGNTSSQKCPAVRQWKKKIHSDQIACIQQPHSTTRYKAWRVWLKVVGLNKKAILLHSQQKGWAVQNKSTGNQRGYLGLGLQHARRQPPGVQMRRADDASGCRWVHGPQSANCASDWGNVKVSVCYLLADSSEYRGKLWQVSFDLRLWAGSRQSFQFQTALGW